jgi:hypothetical protein
VITLTPIAGSLASWVGVDLTPMLGNGAGTLTRVHLSVSDVGSTSVVVGFRTATSAPQFVSIPAGDRAAEAVLDVEILDGEDLIQTVAQDGGGALFLSGWIEVDGAGAAPASGPWLTTLDRVKTELKVTDATYDTLLQAMIDGVTAAAQGITGRMLVATARTDVLPALWAAPLSLRLDYPIDGTVAVTVNGSAWDAASVDTDTGTGMVYNRASGAGGASRWPPGQRHIQAVYQSGYTTVPGDLVDAATAQVCHNFRKADAAGPGTRGLESRGYETGGQTNYQTDALLPEVLTTFQRYARWDPM